MESKLQANLPLIHLNHTREVAEGEIPAVAAAAVGTCLDTSECLTSQGFHQFNLASTVSVTSTDSTKDFFIQHSFF